MPGRNDLCPCGSGKKYKKCCSDLVSSSKLRRDAVSKQTDKGTTRSQSFSFYTFGLSGQYEHMIMVPRFKKPDDSRNQGGPAGLPGTYRVSFILSRPGFPLLPEHSFGQGSSLEGDSHLAITKPAYIPEGNIEADQIKIYAFIDQERLEFTGYPNKRGFLGKIILEPMQAQSFEDAEVRSYKALAPSLSNWSAHLDIPLHIFQTESVELRTGAVRFAYTSPFREGPFAVMGNVNLSEEYRFYASLYREALSSNTPAYTFLCFFKIIDGIERRRKRLHEEAIASNRPFDRAVERIPEKPEEFEPWLKSIFYVNTKWDAMAIDSVFCKEALGKKLGGVVNTYLRPLRLDVAHALTAEGELTMLADDALQTRRLHQWLPLTKCIARKMLKREFPSEFLEHLKEEN